MADRYTDRQIIAAAEIEPYQANIADPADLSATLFWMKDELRRIESAFVAGETLLRALSAELLKVSGGDSSSEIDDSRAGTDTTWSSSKIASELDGVGGEDNTASSVGVGAALTLPKAGVDLRFKSVAAGTGITLSDDGETVFLGSPSELDDSDVSYSKGWSSAKIQSMLATAGGGEANTTSNVGGGFGLAKPKVGVDLPIKSLVPGTNVSMFSDDDTVAIFASGLQNVVEDLTPQLGGNLDAQEKIIEKVDRISVAGKSATYTGPMSPAFIGVTDNHTYNNIDPIFGVFSQLPPVVEFAGAQTVNKTLNPFGGGILFYSRPVVKTDGVTPSINLSGVIALADFTTYQMNTLNGQFQGAFITVSSSPIFEAVSGAVATGPNASAYAVVSQCTVNAGASIANRQSVLVADGAGGGNLTNQAGIVIANLTKGVNNCDILAGTATVPAGNWAIYQTHEKPNRFNGGQGYKLRAITADRTLDATDHHIVCVNSSAITVTLPSAVGITGREYVIKRNEPFAVNIATTGGQAMDGVSVNPVYTIPARYGVVRIVSGGNAWAIMGTA